MHGPARKFPIARPIVPCLIIFSALLPMSCRDRTAARQTDEASTENEVISQEPAPTGEPAAADAVGDPDVVEVPYEDGPPIPAYEAKLEGIEPSDADWNRILHSEETEAFLSEGRVLWGRIKPKVKDLLRLGEGVRRILFVCELVENDEKIRAQIKVQQQNYHEWKGEIHAYAIGKRLGLHLPPVTYRTFSKKEMERLEDKMQPEDFELFIWSGAGAGFVRASVRYWVESLNSRTVGGKIADEEYLLAVAASLHPGNGQELLAHYPLYLELGRAFLFDYLIYNNDRARNVGTLLLPDGSHRLVLFDHGLAFGVEGKSKKSSFLYFDAMQMMPADVVEELKTLTEEELDALVGGGQDAKVRLSDKVLSQIWDRRSAILEKAAKLVDLYGEAAFY